MKTINTTFEVEDAGVTYLESYLNEYTKLISYKVIADTNELYESDTTFKKLVKACKDANTLRDEYINNHNQC
jgi:hypothetical protein